jgi:putative permease
MIATAPKEIMHLAEALAERYPDIISEEQIKLELTRVMTALSTEFTRLGQRVLSFSIASLRSLVIVLIYLFIVPLLVFFCLKDKDRIVRWATSFMPEDRSLASRVWRDLDRQIGNYVRGKVWEIIIVWAASYLTFTLLGLDFAILLSFFVGLSVLIPYIGAISMGAPVAMVAYFQWGWSSQFAYVLIAYIVIQLIDGNILVTILFSGVVNLHPLAIISAVLVFGGLWGFWGLFFSIPLATLVQAVIRAWPRKNNHSEETEVAEVAQMTEMTEVGSD